MNGHNNELTQDEKRMHQGQSSKVYQHQPPREFIRYEPSRKEPKEITDAAEMKAAIESYVYDESRVRFAESPRAQRIAPGLKAKSGDPSFGLLIADIRVSELRRVLGRGEEADNDILKILDDLSASRKIKVVSAAIPDGAKGWYDLLFKAQVGCGVMEIARPSAILALTSICFFKDSPLSKTDYEARTPPITPSLAASFMRKNEREHFSRQFGTCTPGLASAISKADKMAVLEMNQKIERFLEQRSGNGKSKIEDTDIEGK